MNKPDWKDAPEWANWLVQGRDSAWYWFENVPEVHYLGGWVATGRNRNASTPSDWQDTRESRPREGANQDEYYL